MPERAEAVGLIQKEALPKKLFRRAFRESGSSHPRRSLKI